MDLNNDLKIGTWKKIHEQNAQELDKCSVHAYITCAKSEGYIELIKNVVGDPLGKFDVKQSYPLLFDSNKTKENKMKHNMQTEKDIPSDNRNDDDILSGSADSTTVKNISCNKPKHPCDPEPECPTTPCAPSSVRLQCCSKGIYFKLSCTKLPPDCDHPEARYDCELVDEGLHIDSKILSRCDLKCEPIQVIQSGHSIAIKDDTKIAQIQHLQTTVCSKDGVDFSIKCTMMTPDPNQANDVRFLCVIEETGIERKVSLDELQGIPLKCTEMYNLMEDSVLGDSDAKDYSIIENLNNPQLTDIGKVEEDNLESFIISDNNDELPFNQCKEDDKTPKQVACSYVKSNLPFNPYDDNKETSENKISLICASLPEPPTSSPLTTPMCDKINDLLDNNKLIYACRSKPKIDEVENKCTTNSNESIKFDCVEKDERKSCEEQTFVDNSEKMEIYKCTKSNHSPEQEDQKCREESLASSFIQHHNKTVKMVKVAANDLLCLITDSSKDCCKNHNVDDLNCINAVIDFTKDTINALAAHANKLISKQCDDELSMNKNIPEISEPQTCPRPRKTHGLTSPKGFNESTKDVTDNITNRNVSEEHEQSQYDNKVAQNDLTVKTVILVKESSQDIYGKVCETTKRINDLSQTLTDVLTPMNDEVKNNVTENASEESFPNKPPQEMSYNFESDEYSYDSDESPPKRNIFATLKNKIRSIFFEHNTTDYCTSASSSLSEFSVKSDDDHVPKAVD